MLDNEHNFNEFNWVNTRSKIENPESTDIHDVNLLRRIYPEIENWSDLGIYVAWGQYCQDVRMISWYRPNDRDTLFLGYIHHHAISNEKYAWGSTTQAEQAYIKLCGNLEKR